MQNSGEVNRDPRIEPAERELYLFIGYLALAWIVTSLLAQRFLPALIANGVTVYVVVFGSWFVRGARWSRISLAKWSALSLAAAVVALAVDAAMRRLVWQGF